MSNQSAPTALAQLFARKGAASPVGFGGLENQAKNDNDQATPAGRKAAADEPNAAASLFSIDLRKRTAADEAVLAAIAMAGDPEPAALPPSETAGSAEPVSRSETTAANLILVLLVAIAVGLGIWFVLQQKRLIESRQAGAASEPAATAPSVAAPMAPASPESDRSSAAAGDSPRAGEQAAASPAESPMELPSFDLIRIEPNGEAVIAGRAAPESELILLDNGRPIGKVTADHDGEWAFIPEPPLAPGAHEFSLVVMAPHGTVTVPAVGKPDEGASLATPEPAEVLPPVKRGDYVVQLSSTPTMAGAKRELAKLQSSFAGLLGDKQLSVQQARLSQGSVRYRIRSDGIAERAAARKLCKAFRAQAQECLVIKR